MKAQLKTRTARITGLGLLLTLLSACGAEVTPRATSLYSGSGPISSTIISSSGDGVAECTSFDTTTTRLSGRVTTYYYNGVLQEDKVRMRFTSIADTLDSKSSVYLQIFRWRRFVNASGQLDTEIDSANPVQFRFEKGTDSSDAISDYMTSLNASQIASIRTAQSLGGTTALDFFSKTTMVLNAVDYKWQALKVVLYDGTTVLGQVDILIPTIQANPNRYYSSHDSDSVLAQLHPFWSQRSKSQTETQWATQAKSFCF